MRYILATLLLLFPVCTTFGQRPSPEQVIIQADTLKGINAMSVAIGVEGISDIPESTYRADIESRLRAAGITILPPTENPKTYPCLLLSVSGNFIHAEDGSLMGSLVTYQLMFLQLFPQRVGSQTVYIRGATYQLQNAVWGNSIGIASDLRQSYIETVDQFVQGYKKVNPSRR